MGVIRLGEDADGVAVSIEPNLVIATTFITTATDVLVSFIFPGLAKSVVGI
ncbi:MAG: hypothetical protein ABEH81_01950 [Halopenitus sp.]